MNSCCRCWCPRQHQFDCRRGRLQWLILSNLWLFSSASFAKFFALFAVFSMKSLVFSSASFAKIFVSFAVNFLCNLWLLFQQISNHIYLRYNCYSKFFKNRFLNLHGQFPNFVSSSIAIIYQNQSLVFV